MDKTADNFLTRGYDAVSNYLHSRDAAGNPLRDAAGNLAPTDFSPGILGATIGTGLGALTTSSDPEEKPVDRAKRTIRNALLGGVLGGVGTQAVAGSLGGIADTVGNKPPPGEKDKSTLPGFGSSPLMRTFYSTTGGGLSRLFFRNKLKKDNVLGLLGGQFEIKDPKFVPRTPQTPPSVPFGPQPTPPPFDPGSPATLGRPTLAAGASATQEKDFVDRILKFMRSKDKMRFSSGNVSATADTIAKSLYDAGEGGGYTVKELTNMLRRWGVHGEGDSALGTAVRRGLNAVNVGGYSRSALGHHAGLAGTAASVALPWVMPDYANKYLVRSAGRSLNDALFHSVPDFGATPAPPPKGFGDWVTEGDTSTGVLSKIWDTLARNAPKAEPTSAVHTPVPIP